MEPRSAYILAIVIFSITASVAGAFFGRPMDKIPEGFRLIRVGNRYVLVRIESKSTSASGHQTNRPHPEPKPDLERCWPPGHCNGVPVIDPSPTKLKTTTAKFMRTVEPAITKKVSKTTGQGTPISKVTTPTERPAWGVISTSGTNGRNSLSTNGNRGANGKRKMDQADGPSSLTENETAAISAAVVLGVALVVIIIVLVVLLKKRNKKEANNVSNPGYDASNTFYSIGAPPSEHQYMHIAENNTSGAVRPPPRPAPDRISHIYETLPDSVLPTNRPPQVYQGLMTHNDSSSSFGSSRNSPELGGARGGAIAYAVSPLDYPRRHVPSTNQYLDTPRNMGISPTNYQKPQRDVLENYDGRHQMPVNNKEQQVAVIGRPHAPHIYHVLEV